MGRRPTIYGFRCPPVDQYRWPTYKLSEFHNWKTRKTLNIIPLNYIVIIVVKDVQCYELFGGIALKNHAFSFLVFSSFRL